MNSSPKETKEPPKFPSKNGLFKRENSPFWYYDIVVNGRRLKGSTGQKAEYLARQVRDGIASRARREGVDAVTTKPPTLAEFSSEFQTQIEADQTIKPRTRKQYVIGLELLLATHLAGMRLNEITDEDCKTATFPGNASANIALAVLSKALRFAKKRKRLFGDLPEVPKRHVEPRSCCLEIEQARQIADKMRAGDAKDAFLVIRSCGMRPAEAYAMKWEYLNFEKRIYSNPSGKTKSSRRKVPLVNLGLGDPLAILKRRHVAQGMPVQGWVFPSALAPSGHIESIGKTFNAARDKA
jgi:integrase